MPRKTNSSVLKLSFVDIAGGVSISVSALASKLHALQNLLFHAAATVANDNTARRGPWMNRYRAAVELGFVSSHHSDLVVELALPESPPLGSEFSIGTDA